MCTTKLYYNLATCFVNLDFKLNLNELSQGFNIKFNFSQPNSNPTNDIVQSLQPQFMTSIFKNKTEFKYLICIYLKN